MRDAIEARSSWLTAFQLPAYASELNPAEGIWSLMRRRLTDFAAADLAHLLRVVKRNLKKIQYRTDLVEGCLVPTGLVM